ncbi:fumarylacetoacetase [Nocardioides cavernaquae]|uniref:fumarylacetoacetase n=1 Tax=Nocardioides cavernaquae TaxID=2321396 RepID=A0A3A5H605_9ACTN|nr:fumarylacetoacetase [Nocardioides cavernaquae]RJS46126.1 fumarylacetoacetase [Nocardioides cavernaquae]
MSRLRVEPDDPFGLHNLPYGVYRAAGAEPRVGVRFGDRVVDLALLLDDEVFATGSLNPFLAQGPARWGSVRSQITEALQGEVDAAAVHYLADVALELPFEVADYVDFYASEHHASNLGRLFRPDAPDPLTPNWKHLPIGYHGRSSSIVVSGTDVVRPCGQRLPPGESAPVFGPSTRLDLEAELGFVVGVGSALGTPVRADEVEQHLFGVVLFNDWSARDIQAWEYVPLGPFLGKSFASTVSPWVVPLTALAGARVPVPQQVPEPLPYLTMEQPWGLDIELAVAINGEVISRPPYAATYWSPAQMLAHLTVNGAPTRTGDLFASGTVSGPDAGQQGSLIELTRGGAEPIAVGGEKRGFLEDGDEVVIGGFARLADGRRVGFGEARGRILPARGED